MVSSVRSFFEDPSYHLRICAADFLGLRRVTVAEIVLSLIGSAPDRVAARYVVRDGGLLGSTHVTKLWEC